MRSKWVIVLLLVMNIVVSGWSHQRQHHHHHHHHRRRHTSNISNNSKDHSNEQMTNRFYTNNDDESTGIGEKAREILKTEEGKVSVPFSERRLEKMLEKALIKIIMGDLSTADINLLKSLNYTLDEVLAIREYELVKQEEEKRREEEMIKYERERHRPKGRHFEKKKREKLHEQSTNNDEDFDLDAYNRQAVIDYENLATEMELQQTRDNPDISDYDDDLSKEKNSDEGNNSSPDNFHQNFDKAMEPHVVFKIRYDDSEFDSSGSEEKSKILRKQAANPEFSNVPNNHGSFYSKEDQLTNTANFFHTSTPVPLPRPSPPSSSSSSLSPFSSNSSSTLSSTPIVHRLRDLNATKFNFLGKPKRLDSTNHTEVRETNTYNSVDLKNIILSRHSSDINDNNVTNDPELRNEDSTEKSNDGGDTSKLSVKRINEYEGLEWVEDDVYRVIPSLANNLLDYANVEDNEPLEYEDEALSTYEQNSTNYEGNENDTAEYQNDNPETSKLVMANTNSTSVGNQSFGSYQQMVQAYRKDQGQKAIEDIKSKILMLTGRFNLSSNANKVQRERLTTFTPSCQMPRNTDQEVWSDPFSMNMYFRLNLTWGEHVIAAKLRIYKLPQDNFTLSSSLPTGGSAGDEQEEEEEKRIRISVYYYTKSLKKHRGARKRLMDSVVTPLTSEGTHLALDVRQGLKFWRLNPRNAHGSGGNHGLVIQVEDQDGRPLKPALYIQEPSCSNGDYDQKACDYLPALFVRACTRYVRFVNGETVTYVNCRH